MANSIRAQGDAFAKVGKDKDQLDGRAVPFYQQALQLYDAMAEADTEYTPEVNGYRYKVMYDMSDSAADIKPGDAEKINDFALAVSAGKHAGFTIGKEGDQIQTLEYKKNRTKEEEAKLAKMKKERAQRVKDLMKSAEECLFRALELVQQGKAAKVKEKRD